jgi:hypothetical protein
MVKFKPEKTNPANVPDIMLYMQCIITEIEKNTMLFSGLNITIPRQPTKPPA